MVSTYLYGLEASKRRRHSDSEEGSPVVAINNIVQRCTGTRVHLDVGPEIGRGDEDIQFFQRTVGVASTELGDRIRTEREKEEGREGEKQMGWIG